MTYLHIKNWEEWQSYRKDRGTPPWIKVHRKLLTSPKWAVLSDAEKGQLISIWIVAADNGGQIPNSSTVIRKICQLDEEPNLNKFKDLGFIESTGCQDGVKEASPRPPLDAPETEAEVYSKEVETEKKERGVSTKPPSPTPKKNNRGTRLKEDWDIPQEWGEWAVSDCGWDVAKVIKTGEKFKDHWLSVAGVKGVKLDWFAVWRNWCRRTNEGF